MIIEIWGGYVVVVCAYPWYVRMGVRRGDKIILK